MYVEEIAYIYAPGHALARGALRETDARLLNFLKKRRTYAKHFDPRVQGGC